MHRPRRRRTWPLFCTETDPAGPRLERGWRPQPKPWARPSPASTQVHTSARHHQPFSSATASNRPHPPNSRNDNSTTGSVPTERQAVATQHLCICWAANCTNNSVISAKGLPKSVEEAHKQTRRHSLSQGTKRPNQSCSSDGNPHTQRSRQLHPRPPPQRLLLGLAWLLAAQRHTSDAQAAAPDIASRPWCTRRRCSSRWITGQSIPPPYPKTEERWGTISAATPPHSRTTNCPTAGKQAHRRGFRSSSTTAEGHFELPRVQRVRICATRPGGRACGVSWE